MIDDLKNEIVPTLEKANGITITDNSQYEFASKFLLGLKDLRNKINDTFDPIIEKAHQSHKEALNQKKIHTQPLDEAESIIKNKIRIYIDECEKKRIEEQVRLEKEAQKQQEEIALKIASIANNKEQADAILEEAINNKPIINAPRIESKVIGIASKKIWKWRIKDASQIKREFLVINESRIGTIVKSLGKIAELVVGGIEAYQETIIAASNSRNSRG